MPYPLLYELNTRCWLHDLSEQRGAPVTLANVPETEFARWRRLGFTHIWLMGIWKLGSRSRAFSRQLPELRQIYAKLLPNFSEDDLDGSAYAIAGYEISEALGGETGLTEFRRQLIAHGLKLILDFIPNHTGLDHPWLGAKPDLFVQSPSEAPGTFREITSLGPRWIAHGKDPYFPAWADTAQLDYRNPATRAAMIQELKSVAGRCDGVRCDMAMLVLNDVFAQTWAQSAAQEPRSRRSETEFWAEAISAIRAARSDFLFLAEAYWDLETRLLELGFDFAYDKKLTDYLATRRSPEAQRHLLKFPFDQVAADVRGQTTCQTPESASSPRLLQPAKPLDAFAHFLENHDELRIASLLPLEEHRAAALLILGLPGMRLLHEGQLTGATHRTSVHLRRRPIEVPQPDISAFYEFFLTILPKTSVGQGRGELLKPTPAWDGNPTADNFIVIRWETPPLEVDLVAVNLAPHPSQCYVKLNVEELAKHDWKMINLLGEEQYQRQGTGLREKGLYLDLPAHGAQLFHFNPASKLQL